jgi:hypothetical protein
MFLVAITHKSFDGFHLSYGIWVDALRVLCMILGTIAGIMNAGYWRALRGFPETNRDALARSWLAIGLQSYILYILISQASRLGQPIKLLLPLALLGLSCSIIGFWKSKIYNHKG